MAIRLFVECIVSLAVWLRIASVIVRLPKRAVRWSCVCLLEIHSLCIGWLFGMSRFVGLPKFTWLTIGSVVSFSERLRVRSVLVTVRLWLFWKRIRRAIEFFGVTLLIASLRSSCFWLIRGVGSVCVDLCIGLLFGMA